MNQFTDHEEAIEVLTQWGYTPFVTKDKLKKGLACFKDELGYLVEVNGNKVTYLDRKRLLSKTKEK